MTQFTKYLNSICKEINCKTKGGCRCSCGKPMYINCSFCEKLCNVNTINTHLRHSCNGYTQETKRVSETEKELSDFLRGKNLQLQILDIDTKETYKIISTNQKKMNLAASSWKRKFLNATFEPILRKFNVNEIMMEMKYLR